MVQRFLRESVSARHSNADLLAQHCVCLRQGTRVQARGKQSKSKEGRGCSSALGSGLNSQCACLKVLTNQGQVNIKRTKVQEHIINYKVSNTRRPINLTDPHQYSPVGDRRVFKKWCWEHWTYKFKRKTLNLCTIYKEELHGSHT